MFTPELRRSYESNERYADSGARPVIDTYVDGEQRERRFMPRGETDFKRFESFAYGVRQVVRRNGRLEPAF